MNSRRNKIKKPKNFDRFCKNKKSFLSSEDFACCFFKILKLSVFVISEYIIFFVLMISSCCKSIFSPSFSVVQIVFFLPKSGYFVGQFSVYIFAKKFTDFLVFVNQSILFSLSQKLFFFCHRRIIFCGSFKMSFWFHIFRDFPEFFWRIIRFGSFQF